jgi:protein SCO1/2
MRLRRAWAGAALLAALFPLSLAGCRHARSSGIGEAVNPAKTVQLSGVNWDGAPFRLSDHPGKVSVVFFGYTYCPDVCPFTLAKMKQVFARLGHRAGDVQVVFVSVDPQRDTVEKLAHYVPGFDRRFYGLHLDPAALDETAKVFDVTVRYGQPKNGPDTPSFYLVDHTATFFLIDRQGRLRLKMPPSTTVEQIVPEIEALLAV